MRTGGLLSLARMWASHLIRSHAERHAIRMRGWADFIDPTVPKRVAPPREWDPRLWDRDGDPRADNEDRLP